MHLDFQHALKRLDLKVLNQATKSAVVSHTTSLNSIIHYLRLAKSSIKLPPLQQNFPHFQRLHRKVKNDKILFLRTVFSRANCNRGCTAPWEPVNFNWLQESEYFLFLLSNSSRYLLRVISFIKRWLWWWYAQFCMVALAAMLMDKKHAECQLSLPEGIWATKSFWRMS